MKFTDAEIERIFTDLNISRINLKGCPCSECSLRLKIIQKINNYRLGAGGKIK